MQKSRLLIAALAGALLLPVTSCKKGENDPASLGSRTGRLVGTWNLMSSTTRTVWYDDATDSYSINYDVYDGDSVAQNDSTLVGTSLILSNTTTSAYSQKFEVAKDGSFTMTETWGTNTTIYEGYWYWSGGSEAGDIKKKEVIIYTITSINDGSIDTYSGTSMPIDGSYQLDRLSKKEMWMISNVSNSYSGGNTYNAWSNMTYEKE